MHALEPIFCTTVLQLQDVLKTLTKPNVPKQATVREADLMSAPQYGVRYNTGSILQPCVRDHFVRLLQFSHTYIIIMQCGMEMQQCYYVIAGLQHVWGWGYILAQD